MSHPDATVALMRGAGEVTSHFSVPPYQNMALKAPGVRAVLNSTDVMGGPATITLIFGTVKFRDANPKTMAVMMAALKEASDLIARDKRTAADPYLKGTKEKITVDELTAMIESPGFIFTQAPNGTLKYADQMYKTGVIKTRLNNWKDAFFPDAHSLPGN